MAEICANELETECCKRTAEDSAYLVMSTIFIMFLQAAFGFLEGGSVRSVCSVNIMMQRLADMAFVGMGWFFTGWGLAYGTSLNGLLGTDQFLGTGVMDPVLWFHQYSFAITVAAIHSAGGAERMKLHYYVALSFFMSIWTYPIVAHWVWHDDGWLHQMGIVDLAGAGCIHIVGGTSALILAWWLGPRIGMMGREIPDGIKMTQSQVDLFHRVLGDDPVYQLYGALALWVSWYALNGSSTMTLFGSASSLSARVMISTTTTPSVAVVVGMILSAYKHEGKILVRYICDTVLIALVTISAIPHAISIHESMLLGIPCAYLASAVHDMVRKAKLDDPIGAIAVHLVGGLFGLISAGLLASRYHCDQNQNICGLFHCGNVDLFVAQLIGAAAIFAWVAINTFAFLIFFEKACGRNLRVTPQDELIGLDLTAHGIDHYVRITGQAELNQRLGFLRGSIAKVKEARQLENLSSKFDSRNRVNLAANYAKRANPPDKGVFAEVSSTAE